MIPTTTRVPIHSTISAIIGEKSNIPVLGMKRRKRLRNGVTVCSRNSRTRTMVELYGMGRSPSTMYAKIMIV